MLRADVLTGDIGLCICGFCALTGGQVIDLRITEGRLAAVGFCLSLFSYLLGLLTACGGTAYREACSLPVSAFGIALGFLRSSFSPACVTARVCPMM